MSTDKPAIPGEALPGLFASGLEIRRHKDLGSGDMLVKNLACFAEADGAGIVPGARGPIVLTPRADSPRFRMAPSCAVATLHAVGRRRCAQAAAA